MPTGNVTRRKALKLGAAASALPLVHIRTAGAAGRLSVGFWDHWVPDGNAVMRQQVAAWSDKSKVEVQADFITSANNKNLLTIAAEAQARTGHDIQTFPTWEVLNHADVLEPVDGLMGTLSAKYGPTNKVVEYLGKSKGHWIAIPSFVGHADEAALRAHQPAQAGGRAGCAGDVPRRRRPRARCGVLDL